MSFLGANYIDRPSISASGSTVFIAYTDASGGEIRLQRSTDSGASFDLLEAIGATTLLGSEGYSGEPVVAVSGNTVAVIWNDGTSSQIRVSTNGGDDWAAAEEFDDARYADASAAHRDGRLAFAWTDTSARHVYARVYTSGTLGPIRTIVTLSDATTYKKAHNPAVALTGTSRIGVAYSACNTTGCDVGSSKGSSIRWLESAQQRQLLDVEHDDRLARHDELPPHQRVPVGAVLELDPPARVVDRGRAVVRLELPGRDPPRARQPVTCTRAGWPPAWTEVVDRHRRSAGGGAASRAGRCSTGPPGRCSHPRSALVPRGSPADDRRDAVPWGSETITSTLPGGFGENGRRQQCRRPSFVRLA